MKSLGVGSKYHKTQKRNYRVTKTMKKHSSKKTRRIHKQQENLVCKFNIKNKNSVYSDKEFNSSDGMLTSVWGPSLWHTLHTISFNYPINPTYEDKKRYKNFICSLRYVLPCKHCRINLQKNFKSLPPTMEVMENRETFSKYIYDLHELVNKMLNKKSNLSYCDVKTRYEHFRARCTDDKNKVWKIRKIKKTIKNNKKRNTEKGCTTPLYSGEKSKCIIKIVPQSVSGSSFQMDKKCEKKFIEQ